MNPDQQSTEIVSAAPAAAIIVGDHGQTRQPIILQDGSSYWLKEKEYKFLETYLVGLNMTMACVEVGWSLTTGKSLVKRPYVKLFLKERLQQKCEAAGVTLDKILAMMNEGLDGRREFNEDQIVLLKEAFKYFKPSGPSVQVNVQTNVNNQIPSPYAAMSPEQLGAAMKERVQAIESGQVGSTEPARSC